MSGPTDGAAAGVAASGDQTEGAEGEDNKEASISSRAPAIDASGEVESWRCVLSYLLHSNPHPPQDDNSFLPCDTSLYGVTEYDHQRTRDRGVTK